MAERFTPPPFLPDRMLQLCDGAAIPSELRVSDVRQAVGNKRSETYIHRAMGLESENSRLEIYSLHRCLVMLTIRTAQLAAFEEVATKRFVEETAAELKRILRRHCEALGPEGVRDAIRAGVRQASAYGIVSERGAAGYLRLMFMFGADFDRKHEWARQILQAAPASDGDTLVVNLAGAAEQFLRDAAHGISR